ncbi:MAG: endonuclease [Deltaproteobacteria bacterium]|nr:MAG: endonuclease [Deltaproteobacteria bacterium]
MSWFVYIVKCSDGSYYTGSTNDIARRIDAHNKGRGAKYTAGRGPVSLVYTEPCPDRSLAVKREAGIKKLSRRQKAALIESSPRGGMEIEIE